MSIDNIRISVLMVGVDKNRIGGMWTVAETFISNELYNSQVNLTYVSTSTGGSKFKRICKMLGGYLKILICLIKDKIDIVHIHMAEKGSVYRKGFVVYIAKKFHKKVIIQMHAGPFMDWYVSISKNKQKLVKNILNSADRIVVLGKFWKDQMCQIIVSDKIDVLYNGIRIPEKNNYKDDGENIVFLGMLVKTKGIYDLIEAIKLIEKKIPDNIKVLICGEDSKKEVSSYITELQLSGRIKMLGWVSGKKKEKVLSNALLFVLPSYYEALSMSVIEAMSRGIPVLTTNISTMPEILGESVKLVEPGNIEELSKQIYELIKDRDMRRRYSDVEYERANRLFSDDKVMRDAISIYKNILNI